MRVLLDTLTEGPLRRGDMRGDYRHELHMPDTGESAFADTLSELISLWLPEYPVGPIAGPLIDSQGSARRAFAIQHADALQRELIRVDFGDEPEKWKTLGPYEQNALRQSKGLALFMAPTWDADASLVVVESTVMQLPTPIVPEGSGVIVIEDLEETAFLRSMCRIQDWRWVVDGVSQ